jgi:hypothetical protein
MQLLLFDQRRNADIDDDGMESSGLWLFFMGLSGLRMMG